MSRQRKEALDDIHDLIPEILNHLTKLHDIDSPEDYNHWRRELNAWFEMIERLARHVGRKTQAKVLNDLSQWKQAADASGRETPD
jgi:DNA phosphorothioation-dependent restriction protein DptG